ncbi:MAG: response regulator [Treponema sp.]|jgi:signal transduction histidine kinase|nr:response regulator [Treponema sp.]
MESAEKNTILIIDDETINLEILNCILSPEYTIYMTKSGSSAIEMANKYVPDLILLDIIMPEMDGYEVLQTLKNSEKTQNIPVVFITGLSASEDEEKGLSLDAADFIHKPFSAMTVRLRVRNQIQIVNQFRAIKNYAHEVAAAEERGKFFARMSHEMRTPLNAVIGLSGMTLEQNDLSDEVRQNVEKISNSGSSLLALVNDILDISKIDSGKFGLTPVEYSVPAMISDAAAQNVILKGEKQIDFILNIDKNLPKTLFGDNMRIKQILNNFLSNAFKFTMKGSVELNVKYEPSDLHIDGGKVITLVVSIKDTGIGIKREDISSLFADYTQMDVRNNREIGGTGLGLSIAKMIVDMMGGSISVESEYGKGSTFTVKLPQKLINNEVVGDDTVNELKKLKHNVKTAKDRKRLHRINMRYANVLVVDDMLTNIDVAKAMLKPYKMRVDSVTSGQDAIDAVREEKVKYDAIFMDHMMPKMDGIEALQFIREKLETKYAKTVPIIALTANAIAGSEEMFLKSGFQAFVPKPIDVSRLDAVLRQWVRNEELEKLEEDTVDEEPLSNSGKEQVQIILNKKVEGMDIANALKRFSGDVETFLHVMQSFSKNTRDLLETMKEVNENNLAEYAINVHGIKSSCLGVCADEAGNKAGALEKAAKAGDLAFVKANNLALIEDVLKLIKNIEAAFPAETPQIVKLKKDKPYEEVLKNLYTACDNLQMQKVETIMKEIESFEYTADDGLVSWLRDNVNKMNYLYIVEKLSCLLSPID